MNHRIDKTFQELRQRNQKAFIAFITAGDPDLETTEALVLALEQAGVDIIELGVPFSDPLADGPTIQASSQRALQQGANLKNILALVKRLRRRTNLPIALMTYYNPVFHYGEAAFVHEASRCGVDGLIIPDLPPEEAGLLIPQCRVKALANVFFLSPTTTPARRKQVVQVSTGFIYYVALTGVTGARRQLDPGIQKQIQAARKGTSIPLCVGFGVSTPSQVQAVAQYADGVIVGSAIVNEIVKHAGKKDLVHQVSRFVGQLAKPLR